MSPPTRRRGPATTPDPSSVDIATDTLTVPDDTHPRLQLVPVAYGKAYAPCGRRRRWLTIVDCPECGGVHAHFGYSDQPRKGLVRAGCFGSYWIALEQVAREAPAAVSA